MNAESMLKGRMAETLVEELLKQSGNIVYRFGYEALVQNLVQLESSFDRNSEVGERIRAIPDFVVIDKKGEPSFLEVKFRWKPELDLYDETIRMLDKIGKYWNSQIVFVNCWEQPYFRISTPPYMSKDKKLITKPLLIMTQWHIDKKVYSEFEELVHKYLTPTLVPPKK